MFYQWLGHEPGMKSWNRGLLCKYRIVIKWCCWPSAWISKVASHLHWQQPTQALNLDGLGISMGASIGWQHFAALVIGS